MARAQVQVAGVLIFLNPSDDELAESDKYEVFLWCTCSDESYGNPATQKVAQDFTEDWLPSLPEHGVRLAFWRKSQDC